MKKQRGQKYIAKKRKKQLRKDWRLWDIYKMIKKTEKSIIFEADFERKTERKKIPIKDKCKEEAKEKMRELGYFD